MAHLLQGTKLNAKKQVARTFQNDVQTGRSLLHDICDDLFHYQRLALDSRNTLEWIKTLISEDDEYDAFCTKLRNMDSSTLCGCVWTANFVAYRCRTCATSPCMSLCAACFENGNHKGHDYNIFRSEAGGACDCGDSNVMQAAGFCSRHGSNRTVNQPQPPHFLEAAKVLIERMLLPIMQLLRQHSLYIDEGSISPISDDLQLFLALLLELVKLGSVMRNCIAEILLNEDLYTRVMNLKAYKCLVDSTSSSHVAQKESINWFQLALKNAPNPKINPEIQNTGQFNRGFEYRTYLDELTFWIVRFKFDESIILVVLNLLPDIKMKQEFSRCFVRHYSRIALSLSYVDNVDKLSNRIVHISVQLFSNEEVSHMLVTEENLLQIFMIAVYNILDPNLESSNSNEMDLHQCLDITSKNIKSNSYWPIVSDFGNVLSHQKITLLFLSDTKLLSCWLKQVLCFCGMDLTHRYRNQHIEYEPPNSLTGFYSERESCASPLWWMLAALQDARTTDISISVIQLLLKSLKEFFNVLGFHNWNQQNLDKISFHYPLHRYLAHFLSNAIRKQGVNVNDFNVSQEDALFLMNHPLKVLASAYEIQTGLWVRNGMHLQTQSLAYRQHFFCRFFIDADMYLLQFCACIAPPDVFIGSVFRMCRVDGDAVQALVSITGLQSFDPEASSCTAGNQLYKMIEAAFNIIHSVLSIRILSDYSDEEILRTEIISLLTVKACTHSGLSDRIPQSHEAHTGDSLQRYSAMLSDALARYAVKREGGAMEQTTYTPTDDAWCLYDPDFVRYRTLYQRELQKAHSNYVKHFKDQGKIDSTLSDTDLWPPYKPIHYFPKKYKSLSRLLRSRLLYSLIFAALYNATVLTDSTIAIVLHLLEAVLRLNSSEVPPEDCTEENKYVDPEESWYQPLLGHFPNTDPYAFIMEMVKVQPPNYEDKDVPLTHVPAPPTGECILSLLIRLYNKHAEQKSPFVLHDDSLSGEFPIPVIPSTRPNVISNILHFAASKNKDVCKMIHVITKSLIPPTTTSSVSPASPSSSVTDKEWRRKQARKAQAVLMQQLLHNQQLFVENTREDVTLSDVDRQTDSTYGMLESVSLESISVEEFGLETMPIYSCVICGTTETELEVESDQSNPMEKLMALICFVQPSTVLGHCKDTARKLKPYKPADGPSQPALDRRSYVLKRRQCYESLRQNDYMNTFRDQNLLATAIGTHITTCGHHVHLSCHDVYYKSVVDQVTTESIFDVPRGFECPLCRQVSNLALPCNIRPKQTNSNWLYNNRASMSQTWLNLMNDINYISYVSSFDAAIAQQKPGSCNPMILNISLIRANLEFRLMELDFTLLTPSSSTASVSSATRKQPIGELFILAHRLHKVHGSKEHRESVRSHVKNLQNRLTCGSIELDTARVALLFEDPIASLLLLCLEEPLSIASFQAHVKLLYSLVFVQALVSISCKFSNDERRAWQSNATLSSGGTFPDSMESLLGLVIHSIPVQLYERQEESLAHMVGFMGMGYSTTVFTTQSVSSSVESILTGFLQLASLLQHYLFSYKDVPIQGSTQREFAHLVAYLGLCDAASIDTVDAIKCLKWENPRQLISSWCSEAYRFILIDSVSARTMMTGQRRWLPPKLLDLPRDYSTLFQFYRMSVCPACGAIPKDPALCLVCGAYVCFRSPCAPKITGCNDDLLFVDRVGSPRTHGIFGGCNHARRCGAGTCILLSIETSVIYIIRGMRACSWGTLYLDEHGEEDKGWKRGKPLFLKTERLELLQRQWTQHLFDHACKGWTGNRKRL